MFQTELQVRSPWDEGAEMPRFFVPRHFGPVPSGLLRSLGLTRLRYEELKLGVPDFQWNNRPDPLYHRFGTARDPEAPELRIFLLRASGR